MAIGDLLRSYRERAGLYMKELAQTLECSESLISRVENGKLFPSRKYIRQFVNRGKKELKLTAEDEQEIQTVYQQGVSAGTPPPSPTTSPTIPTPPLPAATPSSVSLPHVYDNLPPRYGDFLGREADLARVLEGLASRWPVISIEGLGGVGKSTLAVETACRCLSGQNAAITPPFVAVVWVSAKDHLEQKRWLNETLDTIARVLKYQYITQLTPEQKPPEVDTLLRTHRTLVIVDNFETIDDPDLTTWIEHIPEPSKVILTTRQGTLRRVWDVHLRGLAEPDAVQFIRQHLRRLGLRALEAAPDNDLLPLARVTENNPKAMEMALGYVKYGVLNLEALVYALHTASQTVGNIFDDLFQRAWDTLTEDARNVLLAMTFFADTACKEALGAAAGLGAYRLHTALSQLTEMSFVEADSANLRYSVHPLTRAFAMTQLGKKLEWEREARERWVAWYISFLTQYMPEHFEFWPLLKIIRGEENNLLLSLNWTFEQDCDYATILTQLLWPFFWSKGQWNLGITYTQRAIQKATKRNKLVLRLWLMVHLSWLLIEQFRLTEASEWLHRAEAEIVILNQPELGVTTFLLYRLARLYIIQCNWERAETYCNHMLDMAKSMGKFHDILMANYQLVNVFFHRGHLIEAEKLCRELVIKSQQAGWKWMEGFCACRLSNILMNLNQLEEAEFWLNNAAKLAFYWEDTSLLADVSRRQIYLAEKQERFTEALLIARDALELHRRLGASQYEAEICTLITSLETALKTGATGLTEAQKSTLKALGAVEDVL